MKQLEVTSYDAKQRLDKYLKRVFPQMGTSFMYKMLRKKNITLNGKKATGSEQVCCGDLIQCFFSDETFDKFAGNVVSEMSKNITDAEGGNHNGANDSHNTITGVIVSEYTKAYKTLKGIEVLYEDEHILLVDKPAGILSQKANPDDVSLNEWMIGYLLAEDKVSEESLKHFKPSVCNRLDRNTSGLVICGKTLPGSREMSRILKDRSLQKFYRTYVYGRLEGKKTLIAFHKKDAKNNQAAICYKVSDSEKNRYDEIITAYRTIEAKEMYSYLEIELITGKTHQIRAHLAAYGHPIVGDGKYGGTSVKCVSKNNLRKNTHLSNKDISMQKNMVAYPKYQLLHAYRVVFPIMEGEFAYLSGKEFVCREPEIFEQFKTGVFK